MKQILSLILLISSFSIWANCNVYIAATGYHHDSGNVIQFNFDPMFFKKGYTVVGEIEEADFVLDANGDQIQGRYFAHAQTEMILSDVRGEELIRVENSKRCYTTSCAVSDFVKSFNKSYKEMSKKLQGCNGSTHL